MRGRRPLESEDAHARTVLADLPEYGKACQECRPSLFVCYVLKEAWVVGDGSFQRSVQLPAPPILKDSVSSEVLLMSRYSSVTSVSRMTICTYPLRPTTVPSSRTNLGNYPFATAIPKETLR